MIPPILVMSIWPIVVLILFMRQPPAKAVIWSILAGYLLLPRSTGFNFPLLPFLDKDIVPALAAIAGAMIALQDRQKINAWEGQILPGWMPRYKPAMYAVIALALGAAGTVITNGDTLRYGERTLVALQSKHILPLIFEVVLAVVPFFLARRFLGHPDGHKMLLRAFAISGLAYSIPTLIEVIISPQLNIRIYGFFQHSWIQHVRRDGYRPIVFLQHGLWLSLFLSTAILSCLVLYRASIGKNPKYWLFGAIWLLVVLYLSKSLGAFIITLALAPIILLQGKSTQLIISAVIAAIVLTYPITRGAGLIPVNQITNIAFSINESRGHSLITRLNNEDALLEKAQARPIFGWSTWAGRNRIYNESGRDVSLTDGYWVISISAFGWVGYLARFVLLTSAIIFLAMRRKQYNVDMVTAGLIVVLVGNLIDLIPNAALTPLTWLMVGALVGRIEYGNLAEQVPQTTEEIHSKGLRHTRFEKRPTRTARAPADLSEDANLPYMRVRHDRTW